MVVVAPNSSMMQTEEHHYENIKEGSVRRNTRHSICNPAHPPHHSTSITLRNFIYLMKQVEDREEEFEENVFMQEKENEVNLT